VKEVIHDRVIDDGLGGPQAGQSAKHVRGQCLEVLWEEAMKLLVRAVVRGFVVAYVSLVQEQVARGVPFGGHRSEVIPPL
jgi:hypothetical protein